MVKKKTADIIALEGAVVDDVVGVNAAIASAVGSGGNLVVSNSAEEQVIPAMTSAEWSDFVMKQFAEDEIFDGMPNVDGLRRVAEIYVGEIVSSKASCVIPPGGPRDSQSATVEYTVTFVTSDGTPKTYTEVADVSIGNTEKEYAKYPSATAATRAEARVYRKALKLKRVVASEEVQEVEGEIDDPKATIKESQIKYIQVICQQCDIDVMKFINIRGNGYKSINEVSYASAVKMFTVLSEFKRVMKTIPPEIKGYKKDWRN